MDNINRAGLLSGKTAVVTGAGRGIGEAIVRRFIEEGAVVYAVARQAGSLDERALNSNGALLPVYLDVTDGAELKKMIMRIKSESGKLDILVNNAAITDNRLIGTITDDVMRKMFETNVFAVINLMQLAAKLMRKEKSGSIINIASVVGERGNPGQLVYSATKGAVISATLSAAKELAQFGIRVNAVSPGLTDTDAMRRVEEKNLEKRIANIALGRLGTPEDIADACVFMASDMSAYISGQVLGVNGCSVI